MGMGLRSTVGFRQLAPWARGPLAVVAVIGALTAAPGGAYAQAPEGGAISATPAPPPPPPPPAPRVADPVRGDDAGREEPTDHEKVVGRFGVTYFDVTNLPIANQFNGTPTPGQITSSTVQAPVIGARYWINRRFGVDVGIGLGFVGGSTEAVVGSTDTTVGKTGTNGFAFHAAVPIALAEGRHYAFLVIPGTTFGVTTATYKPVTAPGATAAPDQDLSGFLFDIGARVGAEIHFGFIGIPQLALQATVGLSFRRSTFKWSSNGNSASDGTNTFGTNVQADPWSIFKDAVSATYYF
jgi:hypothetical protein